MDTPSPLAMIPTSRKERWELMRRVVAEWFSPLSSADGYPHPVGCFELPLALREWYQLCGKRSDIWSCQDYWNPPHELQVRDEYLTIIVENQSCAFWGIPLAELHKEDPPVFVDMSADGEWTLENTTTSEFAIQMLAFNIKWSDQICWANGCGNQSALEVIRNSYSKFPFPDWHWPAYPTQFYGTRDLIIEVNGSDEYPWLWVAARTASAFHRLNGLLKTAGITWEAEKTAT